jgi:hypothetical protein
VAIVLGVFLTASHGNEWMKQSVLLEFAPQGQEWPAPVCPPEELEEEGLSQAECEFMVQYARGVWISAPGWFPKAQMLLSAAGTILALISVILGGALVNYKSTAVVPAIATFAALTFVDAAQFAAVVNTGPILRSLYLSTVLLWLVIHIMMTVGAVAGRHGEMGY